MYTGVMLLPYKVQKTKKDLITKIKYIYVIIYIGMQFVVKITRE